MSLNSGLFSSVRSDWRTPKAFYDGLDAEFHFDHDPCPYPASLDGLVMPWGRRNFVNPPYGRQVGKWVRRGWEVSQEGNLVVMLLASRTDTQWFHDYILGQAEIRFIKGRLHFDGRGPAPFPSMVVVFNGTGLTEGSER